MSRYIKLADALRVLADTCYLDEIDKNMQELPSIDIKCGENLKSDYPSLFECSVCGASCDDTIPWDCDINFCPNCGADMRKEGE